MHYKNGFRFATSAQGTLTGEGGDILIADDPHNPVSIYNKAQRNRVINWFSSVFTSRLNNKKKGAIVVIMQRLHYDDLCGHLMEKDTTHEWTIVRLPVVAEKYEEYIFMDTLYKQRKIGDLLCRELEGRRELTQAMRDMGEYNFQAQYQQEPLSLHGNMIKPQWLRYFCLPVFQRDHKNIKYYISIDCVSGIGTENDFTAVAVFAVIQPKFYLCEMLRLKKPYPELKAILQELFTNRKPETILIEDKSNGSSMIQDLRQQWPQIIPIKPIKSKESRVNDILTTLEAGNLLIADNQKWTQTLNIELLAFPECKHDDQVDTISQFINWWHNSRTAIKKEPTIRFLF